jgi:Glucodextranase, domain N
VQTADPAVLPALIVHTGPAQHPYQLILQVISDPRRDVALVSHTLGGISGAQLYVFLASHLQQHPTVNADQHYSGGSDNTAWVDSGGSLFAQGAGRLLRLSSASGFGQASVGYFIRRYGSTWDPSGNHASRSWLPRHRTYNTKVAADTGHSPQLETQPRPLRLSKSKFRTSGLVRAVTFTHMVDMPVIVRHQDRGALRLDHRHDQALCRRRAVI